MLSTFIGLGFVVFSFVSGLAITESHVELLDYLLVLALGSGAVGAANKGYKRYTDSKKL